MGVTAAVTAGALLVGAGTTAIVANQQNQEAKGLAYDQQRTQQQELDQYNNEQQNMQAEKTSKSLRADAEDVSNWKNVKGGTVLTGPNGIPTPGAAPTSSFRDWAMGVATQDQSGRKTLLGM